MPDRVSSEEAFGRPLVCIVDDDSSVRRQLQRQLRFAGYDVETFESSGALLAFSLPLRPLCLLLDVRLSGISGIDLYEQLKQKGPVPPAVFLTGFGGVPLATRAMKEGAVDFLEKPVRKSVLLGAVRTALELSRQALFERDELSSLKMRYESLTPRERQVLDHVVSGQLNKQTAFDLGISEATIKVHRARVMQKMAADSLADLTLMALALGRVERRPQPASPARTRQAGAHA
jgi:FixJ family two-component response regulator